MQSEVSRDDRPTPPSRPDSIRTRRRLISSVALITGAIIDRISSTGREGIGEQQRQADRLGTARIRIQPDRIQLDIAGQ
jgi:hypothetical protein